MARERLGVFRAAVILLVSGLVVGGLAALFAPDPFLPISSEARSDVAIDTGAVLVSMGLMLVVQAIAVVIGVRTSGFRVGLVFTTFVLGVSTAVTVAIVYVLTGTASGDPASVAQPAVGVVAIPIGVVVGIVLPALLIDGAATPALDQLPPGVRYVPYAQHPPYPPDLPPPQPRR